MRPVIAGPLLIATACLITPVAQADTPAPAPSAQAATTRWPSDASLRASMDALAQMLRAVGHDLRQNQRSAEQYDALADWMFKRLETLPTAHADRNAALALSDIKRELHDGADIMTHATHLPARRMGYRIAVQALNRYGERFEHPGWTPLPE